MKKITFVLLIVSLALVGISSVSATDVCAADVKDNSELSNVINSVDAVENITGKDLVEDDFVYTIMERHSPDVTVDVVNGDNNSNLRVTLNKGATGDITVYIPGHRYTSVVHDGVAEIPLDDDAYPINVIIVMYSGDGNFDGFTVDNHELNIRY